MRLEKIGKKKESAPTLRGLVEGKGLAKETDMKQPIRRKNEGSMLWKLREYFNEV